jgi:tetratricopeptide (TPR) repeat protein
MSLNRQIITSFIIYVMACLCVFQASDSLAAARRLSTFEVVSYRTWVKNLQPDDDRDPTTLSYYPGFEKVRPEWAKQPQGRMQAAVRSIVAIEDVLIREWEKSKLIDNSQALGVARSYRLASEYEKAMNWFERALNDGDMEYPPTPRLSEEIFATAVLTGDSLTVTRQLLNTIGYSNLDGYDNTLVLGFRYLLAAADTVNLVLLQDKVYRHQKSINAETRYWLAYSLAFNGRYQECLVTLRKLVGSGDHSDVLTLEQRRWALRSLPDLFYLLGHAQEARKLYAVLATDNPDQTGDQGLWARYQMANMLFGDGNYDAAWSYYESLSTLEPVQPWHSRAREMAALFAELKATRKEGVPYGIDDIHVR